jgi:hypothetical protein
MGIINTGRWIAGGIAAGVLMWIIEGAASQLYFAEMMAALDKAGLSVAMNAGTIALTLLVSLLVGLGVVFFYAMARQRIGAGPRTAIVVGVAAFVFFYLPGLLGYQMIGLYPGSLIAKWAAVGFVETVVISLVGAWIYRD